MQLAIGDWPAFPSQAISAKRGVGAEAIFIRPALPYVFCRRRLLVRC
jgi:hypothetical protein